MALIRLNDVSLGTIFVNSVTPVTFTSAAGWTELIRVDNTLAPITTDPIPNPWYMKWKITEGYDENQMETYSPFMEMTYRWSGDAVTWITAPKNWNIMAYKDMEGRFEYKIGDLPFPRYVSVVARIFPKPDASATTISMLMGVEKFTIL